MTSDECVNTDILSDETFDFLCIVCKEKGKNREAKKFCEDCGDYYCSTCVEVHQDVPSLRGHKILDRRQFPSRSSQIIQPEMLASTQRSAPMKRCQRHGHNYIDMYCQSHDTVGCATCMATKHRLCKDVFYIPEFLQNNPSTSTLKIAQEKLDSAVMLLTKHHDNLQHHKEQLLKGKAESLDSIRKFRKEIDDRLDALEKNSVDEIESIYKALINEIEETLKMVQINKTNASSAQKKITSAGDNISQDFVNATKGKQTADKATKYTEEKKANIHMEDINFTANKRLSDLLQEMKALGNISRRRTQKAAEGDLQQQSPPALPTRMKSHPDPDNVQPKDPLRQSTASVKCNVKTKSDKKGCDIVSACTLEDGTIILSDYHNMKLKRLDSKKFTVTDSCDFDNYPWQVCPISPEEVAVCLPFNSIVQFVSVGGKMKKKRQLKTDFSCHCLAYANGKLYISDRTSSVYIYSVSGSKLRQLSQAKLAQQLFSVIRSLAVSKDGSKIYVSDSDMGLTVLDNNGKLTGRYNSPQLQGAWGCYLTFTGSLLVCGQYSHNVQQFDPYGVLIGDVVKSGENAKYHAVCCLQQMSKMIVSSDGNDTIEIHDLI